MFKIVCLFACVAYAIAGDAVTPKPEARAVEPVVQQAGAVIPAAIYGNGYGWNGGNPGWANWNAPAYARGAWNAPAYGGAWGYPGYAGARAYAGPHGNWGHGVWGNGAWGGAPAAYGAWGYPVGARSAWDNGAWNYGGWNNGVYGAAAPWTARTHPAARTGAYIRGQW